MPNVAFENIMTNPALEISVVIPVYGSAAVLPELVNQLELALCETARSFEIILVCDCSPDNSWEVIKNLTPSHPAVVGILLRKNVGQHNAIMAGLSQALGHVIITMDDDLQHSPNDIATLLAEIEKGNDVVYADFINRNHARWKILGSRVNDSVAQFLLGKPKGLYLSPYRAFKSEIKDAILKYRGPFVYLDGLIIATTKKIVSVRVKHHGRFAGESGYGLKKSISLWMKMATNFSIFPLRLTSFVGFIVSGLGFLFALLLVIQKFTLDLMPIGWSSIIVTLLFLGGLQLLAIGVVGEYLGRVLMTLNSAPQFVVGDKITANRASANNP
jgi:glycosyltransferase involved in cell wall biosynthesis